MNRRILALFILAPLAPAKAQEPATLPDLVVTATRVPTPAERIPAATTVIDRRDIEERGFVTLAEALGAVPGFRLVQAGGPGQLRMSSSPNTTSPPRKNATSRPSRRIRRSW